MLNGGGSGGPQMITETNINHNKVSEYVPVSTKKDIALNDFFNEWLKEDTKGLGIDPMIKQGS